MKKIILLAVMMISLTGCQQINQLKSEATKMAETGAKQIDTAKTSVLNAKDKIEQKVTQIQTATEAVKKLGEF